MLVGGRHDASFLTKFQPVRVHTLRTPLLSIQQQAYKLISHGRITRTRFGTTCAAADHHSFYQVLEIPSDATLSEVKTAYRRLAKRWHPDQCTSSEARDIYQVSFLQHLLVWAARHFGCFSYSPSGFDCHRPSEMLTMCSVTIQSDITITYTE